MNMLVIRASVLGAALSLVADAARADCTAQGLHTYNFQATVSDFIDVSAVDIEACRQPSRMVTSVQQGLQELPCRQIKIVQHWLNTLMDPSTFAASTQHLGDPDGAPDTSTRFKRIQYFFGETWSTIDRAVLRKNKKIDEFEKRLKYAFARLSAVLIASTHPIDPSDDADEPWLWELPREYADIADPKLRGAVMRDDVNEWIRRSGLWLFADAGTHWNLGHEVRSDIDFVLARLIGFMYRFRDYPLLLTDESVSLLLSKDGEPMAEMAPDKPAWADTKVPFSGQGFERELFYKFLGQNLAETENHVLMTLTHYLLVNQWIAQGHRGTPEDPGNGNVTDPCAWWAYADGPLHAKVRDVIARVLHQGVFEDNAIPYQKYTFDALLLLATYAASAVIRDEARNALAFLATKFAFQSLDGRRIAPMRRQCAHADEIDPYTGDAMALALGALTGAYKWNDSPFGYRLALEDAQACVEQATCHWATYTWKVRPDGDGGTKAVGDAVSFHAGELSTQFPDAGLNQEIVLNALFSGHVVPRPVHDFLLRTHTPHYARMMSQFDRDHYTLDPDGDNEPGYFVGDTPVDGPKHNERTPEFYFRGDAFLNVAGGSYNSLYEGGKDGEGEGYAIPANPFPPLISTCGLKPDFLDREQYDFLSRPYSILSEVPQSVSMSDPSQAFYMPRNLSPMSIDEAGEYLPLMTGFSEDWWKSTNVATYKNFSYGYRTELSWLGFLAEWEALDVFDLCLEVPIAYRKMDMEFPHKLPEAWTDSALVPKRHFTIEAASFRLYDLCELHELDGQTGFMLVTARLRKKSALMWSKKVSRGFWEVVPCGVFQDLDALEATIVGLNPPSHFDFGTGDGDKHYRYTLAMSQETVRLSQYYGAKFLNCSADDDNEGRTQGIVEIIGHDGAEIPLGDAFIQFMNNAAMDQLPLIDVKALESSYRFRKGVHGPFSYYACAQDGWLAVNNPWDGSYLWVDSRRAADFDMPPYALPNFEVGLLPPGEGWPIACGHGSGGTSWVPGPPAGGQPVDCNDPDECPDAPGGDTPESPRPDLVPGIQCVAGLEILLTVSNVGLAGAVPSTTRVVFDDLSVEAHQTGPLAPMAQESYSIVLPEGCSDACSFTVTADFLDHNPESEEVNNTVQSVCGG